MKKNLFDQLPISLLNQQVSVPKYLKFWNLIFRVMRITAFFIFAAFTSISAKSYSQEKLTLSLQDVKLSQVFNFIQQNSDYQFLYNDEDVKKAPSVNVNVKDATVREILSQCFTKDYPLGYRIEDNTVIVLQKAVLYAPNPNSTQIENPEYTVSGKVTDAGGEPLVGVTVSLKGSSQGTITDENGNYSLSLDNGEGTLVFSYVGYEKKEILIDNKTAINVTLKESSTGLDQLVVVGYQKIRKKDVTGAVSTISADELVMSSAPDLGHMLQGKLPGLYIKQNSAQPGGGLDILVRGGGSINASNAPLIVIDGFPITDVQQPETGGWYSGGTFSVLNSLNPNDVASITVLKDASATAIYGSRAANGVILITTKRGEEGKAKIRYSGNYSFQPFVNKFETLPLNQWMEVYNEASYENWLWENNVKPWGPNTEAEAMAHPAAGAYSPTFSQKAIDNVGKGTDWMGLVTRTGTTMQHNLSISGGNDNVKYFISGNYYDQKGTVKNSELKRVSFRSTTDIKLSNILTLSTLLSASRINNYNSQLGNAPFEKSGVLTIALRQGPNIKAIDENGNYPVNMLVATQPNPLSMLTITDNGLVEKVRIAPTLSIHPIKQIDVNLTGGLERSVSKREEYVPTTTVHGRNNNGIASINTLEGNHYLLQATANYKNDFSGGHNINILFGTSEEQFLSKSNGEGVTDFISDAFLMNNMGAGTGTKTVSSTFVKNIIASYFGRANYRYKNKYFFTFTMRADGSSVFAPGHKWGYFPSVATAWDITQENFFRSLSNNISQLKLRLSYGATGNASIGTNAFADYYTQPAYLSGSDQPQAGVFPNKLENPDLKWETTTEANIGIDFSILNDRVSGSFDYYNKVISDLLDTKPLNSYNPIASVIANIGKTQSRGFGITINTVNFRKNDFTWRSRLTLSRFYNTWKERASDWKPAPYQHTYDPINAMYYRLSDGILQTGEKAPAAQPDLLPGQIKIKDISGFLRDASGDPVVDDRGRFIMTGQPDGKIDEADYVMLGNGDPSLTGGLVNIFSYKNFTLNISFNAMFGRVMEDPNFMSFGRNAYQIIQSDYNELKTVLNRWTPTNPSTTQPSTYQDWSPYGNGDFFLQKAWFIRLQDVSLTYYLPSQWFNGVFTRAGIHLAANNLALITPYTGVDPETDVYAAAYPNNSTYTFGINFEF